jgi:hypothetical protein
MVRRQSNGGSDEEKKSRKRQEADNRKRVKERYFRNMKGMKEGKQPQAVS